MRGPHRDPARLTEDWKEQQAEENPKHMATDPGYDTRRPRESRNSDLPVIARNPQIIPKIERIQTEQFGLDMGTVRSFLIDFERANSRKRTFSIAGGLVDEAFLQRLRASLGAELAILIEDLRHDVERERIRHAAIEYRLSTEQRLEQSLQTFQRQSDIYVAAMAIVEEVRATNPKAAAEIERQLLADLKTTLRTYNAPIHDKNPDDDR